MHDSVAFYWKASLVPKLEDILVYQDGCLCTLNPAPGFLTAAITTAWFLLD